MHHAVQAARAFFFFSNYFQCKSSYLKDVRRKYILALFFFLSDDKQLYNLLRKLLSFKTDNITLEVIIFLQSSVTHLPF